MQLHQPVMLNECIEALHIIPDGIYLDATFGRGGHSEAILNRLSSEGRLIAVDRDPEALAYGREKWGNDPRIIFIQSSYGDLEAIIQKAGINKLLNGVLVDCGVSSPQLDDPKRGFSFLREGPLDMRMDPTQGISAQTWLQEASFNEMVRVFRDYGEEPFAKKIAREIESARQTKPLTTTYELADLIKAIIPFKKTHRHPATKVFQAIRIHVNQELEALTLLLETAPKVLTTGGRLALISFHSLEDRIIKRFFRAQSKTALPRGIPIPAKELHTPLEWVIKRQYPSNEEIESNPRARSATLRVAQKNG